MIKQRFESISGECTVSLLEEIESYYSLKVRSFSSTLLIPDEAV